MNQYIKFLGWGGQREHQDLAWGQRLKAKLSKGTRSLSLAHQRRLFEGDEDGSHPGNVLRLFAGFGVEVAQAGHPLPLRARAAVVRVGQEGFLRWSAGTDGRWWARRRIWRSFTARVLHKDTKRFMHPSLSIINCSVLPSGLVFFSIRTCKKTPKLKPAYSNRTFMKKKAKNSKPTPSL